MNVLRVMASRVIGLVAHRRREADLDDDIHAHLDALTEDYVRRGMALCDARAAARRDFGGVDQIKEAYRDQAALPIVETVTRDVRYALRNIPWMTSRSLQTLLFGIARSDPATLAIVTLLFLIVATFACYLPARLASRVDPVI